MCETTLTRHEQEQRAIEQQLTEKRGYEYYEHSLKLDEDRRMTQGDRDIARLKAETTLTEVEEKRLRQFAPPAPDFEVIPEQQIAEMGYFKGKTPRRRLKSYKERYEEWETSGYARGYYETKQNIEDRIAKEKAEKERLSVKGKDGELLYQDIKADPASMTKALNRMSDDYNFELEKSYSEEEVNEARNAYHGEGGYLYTHYAFTSYMNGGYKSMNEYLRTGKVDRKKKFSNIPTYKLADTLHEILQSRTINRDMVVRRGVSGFSTLSFMLDGGKSKDSSPEELKQLLKDKMAAGDVFLTDKGFVSTSMRKQSGFGAGAYKKGTNQGDGTKAQYDAPGIEFIILVKKGTHAMDISGANVMGQAQNEDELLIDAGTKFRVVQAYFNDDGKEEDQKSEEEKILMGHKGSWKIYLETVPGSENGELRDN
ncbi:MAG: ADP-ribosyltransferase [Lachnospiraceae bacterium]|nr:ADP-ribosyltransferase [Lachnospiraceae bacterium]